MRPTQQCYFERPWVTLSDLAKYSMTRSVARSLCNSWASCYFIVMSKSHFWFAKSFVESTWLCCFWPRLTECLIPAQNITLNINSKRVFVLCSHDSNTLSAVNSWSILSPRRTTCKRWLYAMASCLSVCSFVCLSCNTKGGFLKR